MLLHAGSAFPEHIQQVKSKAASTTSRKIENAIDKAADGGFARKEKKESTPQKEETATAVTEKASAHEQPKAKEVKLASCSKFDLVPGDKVVLWEDFSQDAIGEFH